MAIYYVRKPPNGNDSNDGLSKSSAWATLQSANENMVAGDIVYIGAGDYTGGTDIQSRVQPDNNGASGNLITFYGDRKGVYTGDEGIIVVVGLLLSTYILVQGIKGGYCTGEVGSGYCVIDACYFNQTAFTDLGGSILKNCIVEHLEAEGNCVSASSPSDDLYFYNNTFIETRDDSIFLVGGNNHFYIKNNILYRSQGTGYFLRINAFSDKVHCDYNSFYSVSDPGDFGLYKEGAGPDEIYETLALWQSGTNYDLNSFMANPKFVGGADFHIQSTSPCRNEAVNVGIATDFDEESRPYGAGYDIGADEFHDFFPYDVYIYHSKHYDLGSVPTKMYFDSRFFVDGANADRLRIRVSFNEGGDWISLVDTDEGVNYTNQIVEIPLAVRGSTVDILIEIDILRENVIYQEDAEVREEKIFGRIESAQGVIVRVLDSSTGLIVKDLIVDQFGFFTGDFAPGCYDIEFLGLTQNQEREININGYVLRNVTKLERLILGHADTLGRWGLTSFEVSRYTERGAILNSLRNLQWGRRLIFDTFIDESKRLDPETAENPLLCGHGKSYMSKSYVDYYSLVFDQ